MLTAPAPLQSNTRYDNPASVSRLDGRRTFLSDGPDVFDEGDASEFGSLLLRRDAVDEAPREAGMPGESIENYERSVARDPSNDNPGRFMSEAKEEPTAGASGPR
jgi:hypothetical protein